MDVNSISSGVNIGSIQFDDIKKIQNSLKKNNDDYDTEDNYHSKNGSDEREQSF